MRTNVIPLPQVQDLSPDAVIAAWIRGEIARRGVQQVDVARGLGLSQGGVSLKLTGRRGFSAADIWAFADLFGITPEELVKRARRDSNPQPSDPSVDEPAVVVDELERRRQRRRRPPRPLRAAPGEVIPMRSTT